MKLKLTLLLICLLGVGLLTRAQKTPVKAKRTEKVTVVDGKDAIPVTVKSNKKSKVPPPPPPKIQEPPVVVQKPEQPAPPPPPEKMKIKVNKHIPPPPPPAKPKVPAKATVPDAPPAPASV